MKPRAYLCGRGPWRTQPNAVTKCGHTTRLGHRRSLIEEQEAHATLETHVSIKHWRSNCTGLNEDTISDAKNLKECDCRSNPDRRCVVCQRDPILRQGRIRENRGKGLCLLPCDIRQTRIERSRRLLRRTRSFAQRLHARQLSKARFASGKGTGFFVNREKSNRVS